MKVNLIEEIKVSLKGMQFFKMVLPLILVTLLPSCVSTVNNPVFLNAALETAAIKLTEQTLPLSVKVELEDYLEETSPVFFFVANDGGHSLPWVCIEDYCDYDGTKEYQRAKSRCEILRLGMECTLLYLGRDPLAPHIKFRTKLNSILLSGERTEPPEKKHGKIIYMPGFSGWSSSGYNFPPSMEEFDIPPVLEALEGLGWDIDVLNIMHIDRAYIAERFDLYENLFTSVIDSARNAGYQRVILYGGSRGGAEIMRGVWAGAKPDAIALMEPDWHGPKYNSVGQFNDDHNVRSDEIKSLLVKQTVNRIVFSFFKNSRWYSDFTREEIAEALGILDANHFLISAPENLEGHGGSWTQRFSNLYSQCLNDFFLGEIDSDSACKLPSIDNSKYENWATNRWIKEGNFKSLSGEEILEITQDKALCRFSPRRDRTSKINCQIWEQHRRKRGFLNEFDELLVSNDIIDLKPSGFCRHNGLSSPTYRCAKFYVIDKDLVAIAPEERNDFYWYRLVDRDKVKTKFDSAIYSCGNKSKLDPVRCRKL